MQRNPILEQRGLLGIGSPSAAQQERMRQMSNEQYRRERREAAQH
jgi:hypothetical protein